MSWKITFDPAKREATLELRRVDFRDAVPVFGGNHIDVLDRRFDYGETRWQTVGFLHGRMVMVVWTERGDARHVISMRKCNEREQAKYGHRLGEA